MAIQHVSIKNGSRGNGATHARYVAGEGRYSDRDDVVHVEDGNLPKWASNAEEFFDAADKLERGDYTKKQKTIDGDEYEKRVKGRAYKEVEAAIPREAKDPVKWAKDYARDLLGDQHPYRLAVHDKAAGGGGRNVHIHLMFSTRTMDGHDRSKEDFFKRAASAYRNPKTKELVQRDPASGGAAKSKYWNSRESIDKTREKFELHVQRVAPDFKMTRSDAPEPKMGPVLKNAGKEYQDKRNEREADVAHLRSLKMVRGIVDKEIEVEQARESVAEKSKDKPGASTDDLWAKLSAPKGAQIEERKRAEPPPNEQKMTTDWSRYKGVAGTQSNEQPPQRKEDKNMSANPMNDLPSGPGYFPESKAEREQNKDEAAALQRLEREKGDVSEQQELGSEKSRTDDLWERMTKERDEKAERDRDDDMGFDR